jgi:hypothetical protein
VGSVNFFFARLFIKFMCLVKPVVVLNLMICGRCCIRNICRIMSLSVTKKASQLLMAEGKNSTEPTVYLCQKGTCHPPVKTAKSLELLLERPQEIRLNIF